MVSTRRRKPACRPGLPTRDGKPAGAWHVAVVACAIAAALAGIASVLLPGHHTPPAKAGCGLVTCTAALPPPATVTAAPPARHTSRAAPHSRHRARPPRAAPATPPAPSPAPPPPRPRPPRRHKPAGPAVTVSYSLARSWDGGFLGHFTITNHGSKPISRWIVNATLPGDHVESGWGASFRASGGTVTLTPASYDRAIAPGGSQSAYFTASGPTTRPTSYGASGG